MGEIDVSSDCQDWAPRSLFCLQARPATLVELHYVYHLRHQLTPYTAGELYKEHFPTSATVVSYYRG